MADEVVGGGTVAEAAAASVASAVSPPVAEVSTATTGVASPAATTQAASDWVGVRDALKGLGVELPPQYADDRSALAALAASYRQAQEMQPLAQAGREYQQYRDQFTAWRQQQAEAERAKAAQAQQSWWKAPEFDPSWRSKLVRDQQTGEIKAMPGTDPSIVQKFLAAEEHRQAFMDKFAFDPLGAVKPGVEEVARKIAMEIVQQHLGGYQERVAAQNLVQQNSSWLHSRDGQGNVVVDPSTGRPQLSEMGQRYAHYVGVGAQRGWSQDQQHEYAMTAVQRDYLLQNRAAPTAAAATGDAAKAAFLQAAAGNRGGAAAGPAVAAPAVVTPAGGSPMNGMRDLQNRMLQNMAAGGILPGQPIDTTR